MPRAPLPKPAAQQTLVQAVTLHQQGRLADAEALYNDVLKGKPNDFDALHLLGVLMHQRGRSAEALQLISKALSTGAKSADALGNRGRVLAALGRHDEAVASFGMALALNGDHLEALFHRGASLMAIGKHADALASYDRVLALRPGHAAALINRGVALRRLGRPGGALACYEQILALHPDHVEALTHRGHALADVKRLPEALADYDRVLGFRPDDGGVLFCRGDVLRDMGRTAEAVDSYQRAIRLQPDNAELLSNNGNVLCALNRTAEGLMSFERALSVKPGDPDVLNNRGNALLQLNRAAEALESYDRALAAKPGDPQSLVNRGNALTDLRRTDEALASYDRAIAASPDHAEAHWNKSLVLLAQGDFANGWSEYEWRKRRADATNARQFKQPLWLGDNVVAGKTILLHAEQGYGDTIQFVRYAPLVAERGAKVVIEAQASLKPLLSCIPGATIISRGETLPAFDLHCPLMSLPLAFKTGIDTVPGKTPYLHAPADRVEKWRGLLPSGKPLRVGLAWSGSPTHKNDHNRSIAFNRLAPLCADERVQFVSLQRDMRDEDAALLQTMPQVFAWGSELQDFADTAAVISLLDLVISVDTGVAHLAGALGKPVWILLPFIGEWRWLSDRDDSPWYPTARLFRQPGVGDWDSVVARVRDELAAFQKP